MFAAASLKNALEETAAAFEAETGTRVVFSFAGSSALARQIQQGAPADLFVSANQAWMDVLADDGLIDPASRRDVAGNRLVLVVEARRAAAPPVDIGPDLDLDALLGDGRLAMALVEAAPAGIYGKAALERLGLWRTAAPRVAQADNVRAALALVAIGAAPAGVVYASDAVAEPRVAVMGRFPADSHPPIVYPAARIAASDAREAAAFLDHLDSPAARAIFERNGFVSLR